MERFIKNYNLGIVLFLLFFFSWIGQGYFQYQKFTQDQQEHNQPVKMEEFWPEFWTSTFENWQSEYLQLFSFVVFTTFMVHKGSPESKDSDEQMMRKLNKIESRVKKKTSGSRKRK